MDLKTKLKERLLEIPPRSKAYREKFRLADDLEVEPKDIKPLLKELCEKEILEEKIEYICKRCYYTTILNKELLEEISTENGSFECDNCEGFINSKTDKTGYIFYDVIDDEKLGNW